MANNEHIGVTNRLKIVLVEQGKTNRWLAEQLGKTQPTVSILGEIAQLLDVDVRLLIKSTKE